MPSSSEASSPRTQPSLHWQEKNHIDARIYHRLMDGDQSSIDEIHNRDSKLSDYVWKPNGSTVLHIAASAGQRDLVTAIVRKERDLLHVPDSEGNLPTHIAVRTNQFEVVQCLVELAKENVEQILKAENNDKNTALHIALENHHDKIASWLFQKCKPTFYLLNAQGISPLYLAINRKLPLVKDMLDSGVGYFNLVQKTLTLPRTKSVVHAMITARNQELFGKIKSHYPKLFNSLDDHGMTPLSYAAHIGFLEGVTYFLTELRQEAYEHNEDDSFPIHKACSGGNVKIVEEFFRWSPYTKWLLNKKGQNILHIAASHGKVEVVNYLLKHDKLDWLVNMKDKDGNTALHLATMRKHAKVVYALTWDDRVDLTVQNKRGLTAFDLARECVGVPSLEERLTWLALLYANALPSPQVEDDQDIQHLDSKSQSRPKSAPLSLEKGHGKPINYYKDRFSTLMTVSVLIATMTFAAGFTVPGGYNSSDSPNPQQGMATLARRHAFQVFALTNTAALYSSIFAAVTLVWAHLDDPGLCLKSLNFALPSLAVALTMMSVAFMAGSYVVLHGLCDWLAMFLLMIGCVFLPFILIIFLPLFCPTSSFKTSKFGRQTFRFTFGFMLLAYHVKGDRRSIY